MNTIKDLLSHEEFEEYTLTAYPFNLSILHNALKQKLKSEPDYEVLVPLVYYKHEPYVRKGRVLVNPYGYFISNKGRILCVREDEPMNVPERISAYYWVATVICEGKIREQIMIHRALGCCFIPLGDLGMHHPKDLQVNHVSGNKLNYELSNLEWSTHSTNTLHAHATGLVKAASGAENNRTKASKGKIIRGPHAGYEFILHGAKEKNALGFIQSSVARCCQGITREHRHCVWSFATEEELNNLPRGLPENILKDLLALPPAPKRPPR